MQIPSGFSSIRAKLILGFVLTFICLAVFGILNFRNYQTMENKVASLGTSGGMVVSLLEARRYEKNYLLYHQQADYERTIAHLAEFEKFSTAGKESITDRFGQAAYQRLKGDAKEYHHRLGLIKEAGGQGMDPKDIAALRGLGAGLVTFSEELAKAEREGINDFLFNYRPFLFVLLVFLSLLGVWSVFVLSSELISPLKQMEEATRSLGRGEYKPIPLAERADEVGSLARAYNRMLVRLRQNNERIVQTEKLTALGTLTSGVAHELNNPLNNISTSCQILLEEMDESSEPYHEELLRTIEEQVAKARDIVGSLLEFSRQRAFEVRREDITILIDETLKLIKGEIPDDIKITVDAPPQIMADVDKSHLVQALINLIVNSIQAMTEGGEISITARSSRPTNQFTIVIQDNGAGIAPEALPRIFDPFFTTKDVGRGTGLGLSITYGIIERHRGRIHVDSQPGEGARFALRMPLRSGGSVR